MIPIPSTHLIVAAVAGALAFGTGWAINGWRLGEDIADLQRDHAEQITKAKTAERAAIDNALAQERAAREDAERIADEQRKLADDAAAVVRALGDERSRLRDDLRRYSAARAGATGAAACTAGGGVAGPAASVVPGDVRDDMLDEAAEVLRVLAPALDASVAKHRACVAIYAAARERLKRMGQAGRTIEGVTP